MQGLILAAGMGKRLKELTQNNTKCMIKVNGVTLIERMLRQLDSLGLDKVVIVIGYEGEKLVRYVSTLNIKTEIVFVNNAVYDKTNNIYSLALAKEYLLQDDTLLLESDLILEDGIMEDILADPRDTLALVDKYESWMDGTCVKISADDIIEEFVPSKKFKFEDIPTYYKTVNVYKFSKRFSNTHYVPFLEAYSKALGYNEYYEQVLRVITMLDDSELRAKRIDGKRWYEIDDIQDLDIAESIFAPNDDKIKLIQSRFGGYWRYPKLVDFCYLVNPYFPPQRMLDEMKANFETLITQYPSGMRVNSLLAAKNFGVKQERIVVGNGAAELIKSLLGGFNCKVGFVRPTFEEYPNRYDENKSVFFRPNNEDFSYSSKDLIEFFGDKDIGALVLINPDNPSGNYLNKADVKKLVDWCGKKGVTLVLDESFVDFSDEVDCSFIDEGLICKYGNLVVVKSISKSYGVPGIRLGILVSSNEELIAKIKKDVAIWNINSFGEFYMQIAEKYKKDYVEALKLFRTARAKFIEALKSIDGIKVLPTQANYVTVKITNGKTAQQITKALYIKYNLLVKDLSAKVNGEYLRFAVRTEKENALLASALLETI